VIDADEGQRPFGEPFNQPLGNAPTRPVFTRTGWRLDFLRGGRTVGCVNAQTLEARRGLSERPSSRYRCTVRMRVHTRAAK